MAILPLSCIKYDAFEVNQRIPGPDCLNTPNARYEMDSTLFKPRFWFVENVGFQECFRTTEDDFVSIRWRFPDIV